MLVLCLGFGPSIENIFSRAFCSLMAHVTNSDLQDFVIFIFFFFALLFVILVIGRSSLLVIYYLFISSG